MIETVTRLRDHPDHEEFDHVVFGKMQHPGTTGNSMTSSMSQSSSCEAYGVTSSHGHYANNFEEAMGTLGTSTETKSSALSSEDVASVPDADWTGMDATQLSATTSATTSIAVMGLPGDAVNEVRLLPQHTNLEAVSVGSKLHPLGTCTPCLYVGRGEGCRHGQSCAFCHVSHQRKRRDRPCRERRKRFYKTLDMIHAEIEHNAESIVKDSNWVMEYMDRLPGFICNYPNMKASIEQGFRHRANQALRSQGMTKAGTPDSEDSSLRSEILPWNSTDHRSASSTKLSL